MKEGIHPTYVPAKVHCACGNELVTRSTHGDFETDVCAKCHPFYTGTQKLIDTAGRVDRFRKRYEKGVAARAAGAARTSVAPATPTAAAPTAAVVEEPTAEAEKPAEA
jgi:large subunit ribosomal protein L31